MKFLVDAQLPPSLALWLRIGNAANQVLRLWFMPQLPQIIAWIEQGVRVLEIR